MTVSSSGSVDSNHVPAVQSYVEDGAHEATGQFKEETYRQYIQLFQNLVQLTTYCKTIKYDPKNIQDPSIRKAFFETVHRIEAHAVLGVDTIEKLALTALLLPNLKTLTITIAGGYEGADLILPKGLQEVRLRDPKGNLSENSERARKVKLIGAKSLKTVVACLCFLDRDNGNLPAIEIPSSVEKIVYDGQKCPKCRSVAQTKAGFKALTDFQLEGYAKKGFLTFIRPAQRSRMELL